MPFCWLLEGLRGGSNSGGSAALRRDIFLPGPDGAVMGASLDSAGSMNMRPCQQWLS